MGTGLIASMGLQGPGVDPGMPHSQEEDLQRRQLTPHLSIPVPPEEEEAAAAAAVVVVMAVEDYRV